MSADVARERAARAARLRRARGRAASSWRAAASCRARHARAAARLPRRASRAPRSSPRATRSATRSSSSRGAPTPTSPRCCSDELLPRGRRATRRSSARGHARLPRPPAARARPACATAPRARGAAARFTHLFVDEFQDTDPLQAEILLLLARRRSRRGATGARVTPVPGKLFLVGDPKQSIYRFRRADVGALRGREATLLARRGAAVVHLPTSFRARARRSRRRERRVRAAHGRGRGRRAGGLRRRSRRTATAARASRASSRCRCRGRYGDYGGVTKTAIDDVAARRGRRVRRLARRARAAGRSPSASGRTRTLPVAPRHVCLLFRRFRSFGDDVTRPTCARSRRAASRTCSSAAARSTSARRSRRCATRSPRSSGPTTSSPSTHAARPVLRARRRRAARLPRRVARAPPVPDRPGRTPTLRLRRALAERRDRPVADGLRLLGELHRAAQPPADRRHDRRAARRRRARTPASRSGRPASRRSPTCCASWTWRAAFEAAGGISFRAFVEPLADEATRARPPRRRSSRRAPRACAS